MKHRFDFPPLRLFDSCAENLLQQCRQGPGARLRIAACLIFALWLPSAAQIPSTQSVDTDLLRSIDSVVLKDMELSKAPGAMILVRREGDILLERPYGLRNAKTKDPVTPSTLFLTASVTKTFTTAALLKVCFDKGISTSTAIGSILPDLPDDLAKLSIHQILSQSSGLLDHWPMRKKLKADPQAYFAHYGDRLLVKELSGIFSYSNFGHVLGGMILSELHGSSFEKAMEDLIFNPLEMEQTGYSVDDGNRVNHAAAHRNGKVVRHEYTFPLIRASASMFSTASDLSKFAACFMNEGNWNGREVLPAAVIRSMSGRYTDVGVLRNYFGYPGSFYGYGLMSFEYCGVSFVGHPGETTTQNLLFAMAPEHELAIVVMSNTGVFPFIDTFEFLSRTFLNRDAQVKEEKFDPGELKSYEGTYFIPSISGDRSRVMEVYVMGSSLYLKLSDEEIHKLHPLGKDHFGYRTKAVKFDVEIRFYRDVSEKVKYLNHSWQTAILIL